MPSDDPSPIFDSHVVSAQMGSRGLQPCINRIPELLHRFPCLPIALHAQDTKQLQRRTVSVRDHLKRVAPDYTHFFAAKHKRRKGRRYNLTLMTLLRNDVAFTAQRLSLKTIAEVDGSAPLTSEELRHCAGQILVLSTKPPGARGYVWHVNLYQHTASASAAARAAVLSALSSIHAAARVQGAAVIIGGDWNAALHEEQRSSGVMTQVDKHTTEFLEYHQWAPELGTRDQFSWASPSSMVMADLDHIVSFPSSVCGTQRQVLPKIDPLHDHHPIAVSFPTSQLGIHIPIIAIPDITSPGSEPMPFATWKKPSAMSSMHGLLQLPLESWKLPPVPVTRLCRSSYLEPRRCLLVSPAPRSHTPHGPPSPFLVTVPCIVNSILYFIYDELRTTWLLF